MRIIKIGISLFIIYLIFAFAQLIVGLEAIADATQCDRYSATPAELNACLHP